MSHSCCSTSPVAKVHLDQGLTSGPKDVEPAHRSRGAQVGERAELLVVGRISTGGSQMVGFRPGSRRLALVLATLALVAAACTSRPPTTPSAAAPEVHIAYYPWYGNPETDGTYLNWTHPVFDGLNRPTGLMAEAPDDIGANYWPQAGLYSSTDPATVDRQMGEIAGTGVDVVVVSWWGPQDRRDRATPLILDAAERHGLRVTFLLEPAYASAAEARSWIVHVVDTYGGHPAFYRSARQGGRPLFYTFAPLKFEASSLSFGIQPEEWAQVLTPGGSRTIRGTRYDSAVVAHVEVSLFVHLAAQAGFDAVNNYFASGSVTLPGTDVGITVSGDVNTWPDLRERAQREGLDFYPSVGPGYKDLRIRPGNVAATRDRRNGAYYAAMVDAACRTRPSVISITSYNEWHEGTQIEPTAARTTPLASYPGFEQGPTQYLDQTRSWVAAYKAGTLCDR